MMLFRLLTVWFFHFCSVMALMCCLSRLFSFTFKAYFFILLYLLIAPYTYTLVALTCTQNKVYMVELSNLLFISFNTE